MSYSTEHQYEPAIDIKCDIGTDVYAAKSGTIVCFWNSCGHANLGASHNCNDSHGFGNGIVIRHDDGTWTEYAHMQLNSFPAGISYGARVEQGQCIGKSGSSGGSVRQHLHFRIRQGNNNNYFSNPAIDANPNGGVVTYVYSLNGSISYDTYNLENVSDTNARISVWVDNSNTYTLSEIGFLYGSDSNNMNKVTITQNVAWSRFHLIYDISQYVGNLNEGTNYYYQFFVVAEGKEYRSELKSFRTTGVSYDTYNLENVSDTNARISVWVDNSNAYSLSEIGFLYGSDSNNMNKVTITQNVTWSRFHLIYDISQYVGKLKEGVNYYYQFFVIANGKEYRSEKNSFTTLGQSDSIEPTITNAYIQESDATGYTVVCTVTDNVAVAKVHFPTWTESNGQDDIALVWPSEDYREGNTYYFRVNDSEHKYEKGMYITHIYAYDEAGNHSYTEIKVNIQNTYQPFAEATYNGHIYKAYNDYITWKEAKAFCEKNGGHLVTISSQEENINVKQMLCKGKREKYACGLTDEKQEGMYSWITEEPFVYENWAVGNPDNFGGNQDFGYIYTDGTWDDGMDIGGDTGFIFECDAVKKDISKAIISSIAEQKYTGKALMPSFTVSYEGKKLEQGKDYTTEYSNNINCGTATITITGIDQYTGVITRNFNIVKEAEEKPVKIWPFSDVSQLEGNWKYEAVKYVYENEIMNGIAGTNLFAPDSQLNRAMFATVLYRMAGSPEVTYSNKFTDVEPEKYYTCPILWANDMGIVKGFSDGSYGVNTNITREQIAKMLYEYASKQGYNVKTYASLKEFTDSEKVSSWATEYMQWAVYAGMITGKPNGDGTFRLDPKGEATRAECAKMLMMFMEKYK